MARGGGGHSGGGGGFHGGGHSSGGGSFGGRGHSSGGSFGGSSWSGGSSSHYSGGSHYNNGSHYNSGHHHHYGPVFYGGPSHFHGGHSSSGCSGCGGVLYGLVLLIVILAILGGMAGACQSIRLSSCACDAPGSSDVKLETSSEKREKMDAKYLNYSNTWYTDELGWFGIRTDRTLIRGLENFYNSTGVQPYVYLASYDQKLFNSPQARAEFAEEKYQELFTDEGHFLWIYFACENDRPDYMDGHFFYVIGRDAEIVLDEEAKGIFETRLQYYYDDTSLDVDEFLAKAFTASGKAIMSGPIRLRYVVLIVVGVLVVVGVVVMIFVVRKKRQQKIDKENEDLEKLLKTPLQTFGSAEAEELKGKYDE